MKTEIKRLYVLLCGYEVLPKTISTRNNGDRFILAEPVCAYLLETTEHVILLDTGIDPGYANDPSLRQEHFLNHGWSPPVVRPCHLLEGQLAAIGIAIDDIDHVILSHLHFDHCARLDRFPKAKISVQRKEYDWAFSAAPGPGYLPRDYDHRSLNWNLVDGDWRPLPGLDLLDTRGHTEGHQSAVVHLPSGRTILLPFDAGDLAENFDGPVLPGQACDDEAALGSILRLKRVQTRLNAEMLLFHDPNAIQHIDLAPAFYD